MTEVDIEAGVITREDRDGNEEADKLATLGVEMHKVPEYLEDVLVENLLKMMLGIMENVQDKAP
eukprot:14610821-Heterocapsa_arctica.AAC.1